MTALLKRVFIVFCSRCAAPVQQAARILFRSRLAFSSDEDLVRLVGRWQHERKFPLIKLRSWSDRADASASHPVRTVPSRRPATEQNSPSAGQALILIGQIAVENQSLFKPEYGQSLHAPRFFPLFMMRDRLLILLRVFTQAA
jgi:hypothetical protein